MPSMEGKFHYLMILDTNITLTSQDRFKLPYTYCGCPLPGDTIGQRLSRFLSSVPTHPPSQLVPPSDRADLFASTHASEHNLVQFKSRNKTALRVEQYRHSSHQAKHEKRVKREKDKERKREREAIERQRERDGYPGYGCMYGQAFLMPVPLYYGAPIGGCVGTSHAVVDHNGACGNVTPLELLFVSRYTS